MEIWDAYNSNFEKIENIKLVRGKKIPDGLFHLVCDILVKHVDKTYLLMQRDLRKAYGGMWEATAGDSALAGETPLECAVRELREETGITASELTEVGRVVDNMAQSIYVEYLCTTSCDKKSISLQDGETIAYRWVGRDELLDMEKAQLITERMQNFIEELKQKK
ncbi:MAG: NUDIX hydrolase [Clostridiales bacterium]|nr:NUDIX hydrolase [Clostridiales bacterium]